jgi:hypothetical protein
LKVLTILCIAVPSRILLAGGNFWHSGAETEGRRKITPEGVEVYRRIAALIDLTSCGWQISIQFQTGADSEAEGLEALFNFFIKKGQSRIGVKRYPPAGAPLMQICQIASEMIKISPAGGK